MKLKKIMITFVAFVSLLMLSACGSSKKATVTPGSSILPAAKKATTAETEANTNEIKLTGVLTMVDTTGLKMHFVDIDSTNEYEVSYSGGTDIRNKYNDIVAASQLKVGQIFDVTCNKSGKATTIVESSDAWETTGVTNFVVDEANNMMTIGATNYKYTSGTVVVSNGDRINANEIMKNDVVTVRGYDKNIYSVTVEKGHGYVKFTGIDNFIDGYADIGTKLVYQVTKDMMVTAPEGEYKITMQKGSLQGSKTITVKRNEEVTIDFSEYVPEPVQSGMVQFSITPQNAIMYIDGTQVDYTDPVQLDYGKHTLVLKANNYDTYTQTLYVNSSFKTEVIDMTSSSTSSGSSSTTTSTTAADLTSGYTVTIKSPEGAAVYVDSVYIGIAPVTFSKSSGNKVITLTKSGCATKSYTISIPNAAGDQTYAFPDMEAGETSTQETSTAAAQ